MQDVTPFIGVISSVVTWIFFLIALAVLKDYISKGFGFALGEFLLKSANKEQREKIVRYFGSNGETVIEYLKGIQDRLDGKEGK